MVAPSFRWRVAFLAAVLVGRYSFTHVWTGPPTGVILLNRTFAEHAGIFSEKSFCDSYLLQVRGMAKTSAATTRPRLFGSSGPRADDKAVPTKVDEGYLGCSRCSETVVALCNYFCGPEIAANERASAQIGSVKMERLAQQHVAGERDAPQEVYRCHLHDRTAQRLGHVFLLHFGPNATVGHYQSFVNYYDLRTWIVGETPHLDSANAENHYLYGSDQIREFFRKLAILRTTRPWTPASHDAYAKLFGAPGRAGSWMNERPSDAAIEFYCDRACASSG